MFTRWPFRFKLQMPQNLWSGVYIPLIVLSSGFCLSLRAETLVLKADAWCPFSCNPKAAQAGYMVDIAREIFKTQGIQVDYQIVDWETAKKDALNGKISGVIGASRGDGDFLYPDIPMGRYQNNLFFKPYNNKTQPSTPLAAQSSTKSVRAKSFDQLESLVGEKIGIVKDYAYGPLADQFILKHPELFVKVSGHEPLVKLIKMLDEGTITALYECPQVFLYTLKLLKRNYSDYRRGLSFDTEADNLYIGFTKKDPNSKHYAEILTRGLNEMRKSGRLRRLLDNYALIDWE